MIIDDFRTMSQGVKLQNAHCPNKISDRCDTVRMRDILFGHPVRTYAHLDYKNYFNSLYKIDAQNKDGG